MADASFAAALARIKCPSANAERMPSKATTTSSSTSVNPFSIVERDDMSKREVLMPCEIASALPSSTLIRTWRQVIELKVFTQTARWPSDSRQHCSGNSWQRDWRIVAEVRRARRVLRSHKAGGAKRRRKCNKADPIPMAGNALPRVSGKTTGGAALACRSAWTIQSAYCRGRVDAATDAAVKGVPTGSKNTVPR